jgi:hypothetical protein
MPKVRYSNKAVEDLFITQKKEAGSKVILIRFSYIYIFQVQHYSHLREKLTTRFMLQY